MNKRLYWWIFALILIIASGLRFYKLAQVPHGMTWDEAAIGYSGFAIFETRRDEWLHRLPISFMSFGDYKAPFAIYLNGFFTALFGMNLWAVRLPFALASIAAIAGMILLTEKISQRQWALAAGVLMTLSPWHLHYSRAGFESGMSLSIFIWSLYFLISYLKDQRKQIWSLLLAVTFAAASIYTYHSAKIVLPLTFLALVVSFRRKIFKKKKNAIISAVLGISLLAPMMWDSVKGKGLERLGSTILDELSGIELITTICKQFLAHLSPSFLLMGETTTLRHGDGSWGVLLPITLLLVVSGLIFGINLYKTTQEKSELFWLGSLITIVGLLPAALGEEVPHSNRALLALPGFVMLAVFGLKQLISFLKKTKLNQEIKGTHGQKNMILLSVIGSLVLVQSFFFIAYIGDYFTQFAADSAADFKDGYLDAYAFITPYEDQVEKIIFTSDYGQPYIYALFVRQTNPIWYQGGSLIKYEFKDEINVGDLSRKKTIVVASNEDELEPGWADKIIYGSDHQLRFKIYLPKGQ